MARRSMERPGLRAGGIPEAPRDEREDAEIYTPGDRGVIDRRVRAQKLAQLQTALGDELFESIFGASSTDRPDESPDENEEAELIRAIAFAERHGLTKSVPILKERLAEITATTAPTQARERIS